MLYLRTYTTRSVFKYYYFVSLQYLLSRSNDSDLICPDDWGLQVIMEGEPSKWKYTLRKMKELCRFSVFECDESLFLFAFLVPK